MKTGTELNSCVSPLWTLDCSQPLCFSTPKNARKSASQASAKRETFFPRVQRSKKNTKKIEGCKQSSGNWNCREGEVMVLISKDFLLADLFNSVIFKTKQWQ